MVPHGRKNVPRVTGAVGAGLAALAMTVAAGCSSGDQDAAGERTEGVGAEQKAAQPSPSRGDGRLTVEYEKPKDATGKKIQQFLRKHNVLENAAKYANDQVALAYDVPVRAMSCGQPNAEWQPDKKEIQFCYEWPEMLTGVFTNQDKGASSKQLEAKELQSDLTGAINGTLFHELGHGLVHMYKLPITGKEEDAVDQLSVDLLASGDDQYQQYAVSTIKAWGGLSPTDKVNKLGTYADEHSLSTQRFFNWTCWLYGSDPKKYGDVVEKKGNPDGVLPAERAPRCPEEFEQLSYSWGVLLKPYAKG